MGKYIVKITHRKTQEVVVDARNAEEAKRRGLAAVDASTRHTARDM